MRQGKPQVSRHYKDDYEDISIQDGLEFAGSGGMSYEDIAEVLNISVKEVRKIEAQALKKLKMPTEKNKKFYRYLRGLL